MQWNWTDLGSGVSVPLPARGDDQRVLDAVEDAPALGVDQFGLESTANRAIPRGEPAEGPLRLHSHPWIVVLQRAKQGRQNDKDIVSEAAKTPRRCLPYQPTRGIERCH